MRFQVIERHRRWRGVDNHLDARHCPICHATVHGNRGQHAHLDWHTRLAALLDGQPEPAPEAPWTSAIGDDQEQQQDDQEQTG